MKRYSKLICFLVCLMNLASAEEKTDLGIFYQWSDIGATGQKGGAFFQKSEGAYYLKGAGENVWGNADSFGFLWMPLRGDFSMEGTLTIIDLTDAPHRKAGWMVRQSLDPDAAHISCAVHGDGLVSLQYRPVTGAPTEGIRFEMKAAEEIRLTKEGSEFTMVVSKNGSESESKSIRLDGFDETLFAGAWVCSKNVEKLEAARFGQVRFLIP
jgi:TolB protein